MSNKSEENQVQSGPLSMVSFEEIIDEAELKKVTARKGADSWQRLLDVASELAGAPESAGQIFRINQTWCLERISISSYRGVLNNDPLDIVFDPTPGITVLHGLNGAGKSSISDAIDLALSGRTPEVIQGTAGKAALWNPVHLARGSSSARIEVTLSSGDDRLLLVASLDVSGQVDSHEAYFEGAEGRELIDLGQDWHQALASHQPVFAYASLERRVQLSKDLANYFESLLALGGSFTRLQETIAERSAASDAALNRWSQARDESMRAIAKIDVERQSLGTTASLDSISTPKVTDEKHQWLVDSGLLELGFHSDSLPSDLGQQLVDIASAVKKSLKSFEDAGQTAEQHLSTVLEQLHDEVKARSLEHGDCPVCATSGSNWSATLRETVKRNQNLSTLRSDVVRDTRFLATAAKDLLAPALAVARSDDSTKSISNSVLRGGQLLDKFNEVFETGVPMQHAVMTASSELAGWLLTKEARAVVDEAVKRTDATKQWRIARTKAVESFVIVWDADGLAARDAAIWTATSVRVEELRKELRERRSDALKGKAGERVQELLADAALQLKSMKVLTTKATMDLVDQNGNSVELGMLSAGQRNAVLLAPLLASVDGGPFGFIVLDDPVHAFDELRIDRLADVLSKLAENRRVIVLTHDDRLKEYLAARSEGCDTRLVERSGASGAVAVSQSNHFWQTLLDDAQAVLALAEKQGASVGDVTDSIRGLCRMGIDNALRSFVLRNGVLKGRNIESDLKSIDKLHKTKDRLAKAETFWSGGHPSMNPVSRSIQKCQPYLLSWNQSIHGNAPTSAVTADEIKAARAACESLVKAK